MFAKVLIFILNAANSNVINGLIQLNIAYIKYSPTLTPKTDIGWGHQIRSYVLQPYQLVKDLRSKLENTNPASVLDGNIDLFIEEGLKNR